MVKDVRYVLGAPEHHTGDIDVDVRLSNRRHSLYARLGPGHHRVELGTSCRCIARKALAKILRSACLLYCGPVCFPGVPVLFVLTGTKVRLRMAIH